MNPLTESQLMINRRQFFGRTATGIGAAALGNLLQQDGLADQAGGAFGGLGSLPHFAPKAKRVIYLFMRTVNLVPAFSATGSASVNIAVCACLTPCCPGHTPHPLPALPSIACFTSRPP